MALSASDPKFQRTESAIDKAYPAAASQLIYYGAMVLLDAAAATAKKPTGTAEGHLKVIGVAGGALAKGTRSGVTASDADNSSGSSGDISVRVMRGIFSIPIDSSVGALTAADEGQPCYAKDDNTISRDSNNGNYALAGIFRGLSDDGRGLVEIGADGKRFSGTVLSFLAGADLSALQNTLVKFSAAAASKVASATSATDVLQGVLLNAPTSGLVALVAVDGVAPLALSGTVTGGDSLTATTGGKGLTTTTAANQIIGTALESGSTNTKMVRIAPRSL